MIPRSASCRRARNSAKSLVWNQQRTSTSSEDGEKARSFATTVSGQTFGFARSIASTSATTRRTCSSVVP
jgi:hypothetical protein